MESWTAGFGGVDPLSVNGRMFQGCGLQYDTRGRCRESNGGRVPEPAFPRLFKLGRAYGRASVSASHDNRRVLILLNLTLPRLDQERRCRNTTPSVQTVSPRHLHPPLPL